MTNKLTPIDELLDEFQDGPDPFQIDYFTTAMAGYNHPWGMFLQACREMTSRKDALIGLEESLELADDALLTMRVRPWWVWRRRAKLRYRIRLAQCERQRVGLVKSIERTRRERDRFHTQAHRLREKLGELTPEARERWTREWWTHKIRCLAQADLWNGGRVGAGVREMVQALPLEMQKLFEGPAGESNGKQPEPSPIPGALELTPAGSEAS